MAKRKSRSLTVHQEAQTAAQASMTLADPIQWEFRGESFLSKQYWNGNAKKYGYTIYAPSPDRVDDPAWRRFWFVGIRRFLERRAKQRSCFGSAPSFASAKALYARHAVSGDWSEIEASWQKIKGEREWFDAQAEAATVALGEVYERHPVTLLDWQPKNFEEVLAFGAVTASGRYVVRYVEGQRWVVTFRPETEYEAGQVSETVFLTRGIVDVACAVHVYSGKWLGVLATVPPML